jgi:DNA repair protein RadC
LSGNAFPQWACPNCGTISSNEEHPQIVVDRPWHVLGRAAVRSYVASLGEETYEWLLALFVTDGYRLLAVDTIARGAVSDCEVNFGRILFRGHQLKASGFVLVHNHPSGDPKPSYSDMRVTARLAHVSKELDIPLIDHLIIAGDQMSSVVQW